MAPLRRLRRAVTLIEVLVAALIVSAVFVVIWYLYSHGMSNIQATERILESTRGAHVLFELLHRDVKRAREVLLPRDLTAATDPKLEPGDLLLYVDFKEYFFKKKDRTISIDGLPFRLGLFDEIAFEPVRPGVYQLKIVPVPSQGQPGESPRLANAGRYVLETTIAADQLAAQAEEPTLVQGEGASHRYCLSGWPLDY
jgi:hypothetical protein